MTALETQLTEIVEKEQGQKIIPFLQKLTQEEGEPHSLPQPIGRIL